MTLADVINSIQAGTPGWVQSLIAFGYGFHVSIGGFSTPITGGGNGDVLDLDQPEGILSVPPGWCLIPFRIDIQLQTPLLATDADESEALITVDLKSEWKGDGTFTAETAYNLRNDRNGARGTAPLATGCPIKCASAFTADMLATDGADAIHDMDLARSVIVGDSQTAVGTTWTGNRLLYEPLNSPLLTGPCAVYLYWGGTVATTGFAQAQFCAIPSSFVTNLA